MTPDDSIIQPHWCDRAVTEVAPDLVGCYLVRHLPGGTRMRGLIVETEAYSPEDPASHAYRGKTRRNASMFGPAGCGYVYLIYGRYHCFNVVTAAAGIGSAVLIRALAMDMSMDQSVKQRHRIAAGPGKLCQLLQIDRSLDGHPLTPRSGLWLEHRQMPLAASGLVQTTRVGIRKAAEKPWRWYLKDSPEVSKK